MIISCRVHSTSPECCSSERLQANKIIKFSMSFIFFERWQTWRILKIWKSNNFQICKNIKLCMLLYICKLFVNFFFDLCDHLKYDHLLPGTLNVPRMLLIRALQAITITIYNVGRKPETPGKTSWHHVVFNSKVLWAIMSWLSHICLWQV